MPVPTPRVDPPKPKSTRRTRTATEARSNRSNRSAAQDRAPGAAGSTPQDPPPMPPPKSSPRAGSLEARLADLLAASSIAFAVSGDVYSAQVVSLRSPALASALADLAKENAAVRRILDRLLEGSAWGSVLFALAAIIIPICQAHGIIPGSDPFVAMMPSPEAPKRMEWGSSPNGGSTMGAPGPGSEGDPSPSTDDETMTRMPGAPPGVVTVAATAAQHPGAR